MKVGIAGYTGRVGQLLVSELQSGEWDGLELAGGSAPNVTAETYFTTAKPEDLFERADVVIDFTRPNATLEHIRIAADTGKAMVIGTTGLLPEDEALIAKAAEKTRIVYAANMSIGVNLLLALVEKAAGTLSAKNWDIEIFESHHKHKIDAPSGTALAIGKAGAKGRDVDLDRVKVSARDGITGERGEGTIGFSVARGGDVVGEHTAYFYGAGERIELTHIATNRALFARGALQATRWLKDQKNGLYSMRDVLNI